MSEWQPIETAPDMPADNDSKVFHALLWGRLHVRGNGQHWVTEWKVLKAGWVYWLGTRVNGSAKIADNWFVGSDGPARVERIEATHWMPLPGPPAL